MPVAAKTPVSFGTLALNDSTNFLSSLPDADSLPDAEIYMSERLGASPFYVGQQLQARTLLLKVGFYSTDAQAREALRNTLAAAFDTSSETEQELIVIEPTGIRKTLDCTVQSFIPVAGGVDIILNAANPIWESYHLTHK